MAILVDNLTVSPIDGTFIKAARYGGTTDFGLYLRLNGAAVAATTATCTARNAEATISITLNTATAGEVTGQITSANLAALSVTLPDVITLFMSGTVVSGSDTYRWEYEQSVVITDREFRFAIVYDSLERLFPQMAASCTYPGSDTSWWPTIRVLLAELRNMLNRESTDFRDYLAANPAELTDLATYWLIFRIADIMNLRDNGSSRTMGSVVERAEARYKTIWTNLTATVKAGNAQFGASQTQRKVLVKPVKMWGGADGSYYGGPL